jgi:hypothetical protein
VPLDGTLVRVRPRETSACVLFRGVRFAFGLSCRHLSCGETLELAPYARAPCALLLQISGAGVAMFEAALLGLLERRYGLLRASTRRGSSFELPLGSLAFRLPLRRIDAPVVDRTAAKVAQSFERIAPTRHVSERSSTASLGRFLWAASAQSDALVRNHRLPFAVRLVCDGLGWPVVVRTRGRSTSRALSER